ncbi:thioredoxin domain-containing protein [Streptomyces sp. RKND-216]|uniref:DsbA family protein n=1 Tax=Streptomyces sp. RKND-216 TaxID=2562581 RepID=UPI001B349373|nr:thioredoxin domain-containing protein [Streptomyces sp. RKND-216]
MTDDKPPGAASARERLRVERERERQSAKRLRTLKMAGLVVLVLAVAALVAVAVSVTGKGDNASGEARPVTTGPVGAPVTMTVYEDFRCPGCEAFESQYRETINDLRDAGKLRVEYHLVTLIDDNLGGQGSQYAAEAAMCANDAGRFVPYHDLLYTNQPPEQKDAFGDRKYLLRLARQVEGLSTAEFETCVRDGHNADRVARTNNAFLDAGINQTPTVLIDGKPAGADPADPLTPQKLRQIVERKN